MKAKRSKALYDSLFSVPLDGENLDGMLGREDARRDLVDDLFRRLIALLKSKQSSIIDV